MLSIVPNSCLLFSMCCVYADCGLLFLMYLMCSLSVVFTKHARVFVLLKAILMSACLSKFLIFGDMKVKMAHFSFFLGFEMGGRGGLSSFLCHAVP